MGKRNYVDLGEGVIQLNDPEDIKFMEIYKSLDDEGKRKANKILQDIISGKITD